MCVVCVCGQLVEDDVEWNFNDLLQEVAQEITAGKRRKLKFGICVLGGWGLKENERTINNCLPRLPRVSEWRRGK